MKDQTEFLLETIRSAQRFRWIGLAAAWAIALAGTCAVLALPNNYQSRAQIYVDTRSVLRPLLQGLAVSTQTQDQTDAVRRVMLARPSLDAVARKTGLYARAVTPEAREKQLVVLSNQMSISGDGSSGYYTISHTGRNAEQSRLVVQTVLDTFVESSVGAGTADTANAQTFFAQQVSDYEKRLSMSEEILAQFKKDNVGLMPDQRGDYFVRLQAAVAAADKVRTDLAVAERQRDALRRKISGETAGVPSMAATAPPTAAEVQEATVLDSRIRDVRRQLSDLLVKFTDRHPDVVSARETLAALEAQRRGEMSGIAVTNGSAPADNGSGAPVDPVMQNLQIAYNTVDVQVASLQTQLVQASATVAELRRLVTTGPEVEAELARLNRDYGVTKAQYEALLQRYETARLSSDANRSEELRFKILEPPRAALGPVSPNRRLLLGAVMMGAVFAGLAIAIGLSLIQPVILSRKTVTNSLGLPVIGTVRLARSPGQVAAERRGLMAFSVVSIALPVLIVAISIVSYPISLMFGRLMGADGI